MNKSNYDKASKVAMDKLMPKRDVSITISMKGGGGLSSLQRMPIVYRDNGGGLFGFTEDDVETFDTWGGGSDVLGTDSYNVPGRARTKVVANQQVPVGFNLAAGRDTTGMLAGGTERPFRESDDPGIYSISTPERSENRKAQLDKAREIIGRADEEVRRTEAENRANEQVRDVASFFLGKNFGQGGGYDLNINPFSFASPDSDYYGWSENIPTYSGPSGGLFDLVSDDPYREVEGGDYGKWTEDIPPADDLFVDDEKYQLMDQRPEQKEKIKEIKEYIDKVNKKTFITFGKTWKDAKEIVNKPKQAAFILDRIIAERDDQRRALAEGRLGQGEPQIGDVPIPDSLVEIANDALLDMGRLDREGAPLEREYDPYIDLIKVDTPSGPRTLKAAKGGGLSSMSPRMNIGGKPYRLSYIDPRQAKVGGPVIRRQDGGEVDMYGTATPDMDYTEDDFTSYAEIEAEEGLAPGTLDPTIGVGRGGPEEFEGKSGLATFADRAETMKTLQGISKGNVTAYDNFVEQMRDQLGSQRYNTYFNNLIEETGDVNVAEKLLDQTLMIPGAIQELTNRFDAGLAGSFRGEGYRYGGPAGTVIGLLEDKVTDEFADPIKKRLQERKRLEKEGVSAYGFDVETMKAENTFGSILDKIGDFFTGGSTDPKTLEGIQSDMKERGGIFTPISTSDKIVEGAVKFGLPGLLGTGLSIIQGLIGRPIGMLETPAGTFYVGKDGSLANASLAASPNLGNEPTSKGTQARTVATTQDVTKETLKEGLDKVLAERKTPSKRGDSLASLRAIIENVYPTGGRVTPPTIV